jgi:hypothetical protein
MTSNLRMSESPDAGVSTNNPKAKAMPASPKGARRRAGKEVMTDNPTPAPDDGQRMKSFKPPAPGVDPQPAVIAEYPPMQPPVAAAAGGLAAGPAQGYVRMRFHLVGEELRLMGMKLVEGPLAESDHIHSELAYEVTVGNRRVATGGLPEFGPNRAFAPLGSQPGAPGHNFMTPSYQEVVVRVDRADLSLEKLPRTNVTLLRVKTGSIDVPSPQAAPGSLTGHAPDAVRSVTKLSGIRLSDLPARVQDEVRAALS